MTTTNTIKFNVGGRPFEVSRDLMDKHSETMLGKLVSDAWQADPEEPVFIDRNGDTFAYVLDYLRYGSIELPPTVPKSSFERDLDFYGLVPNPEEGEIKNNVVADVLVSLRKDRDISKCKYDMLRLAIEVHHLYTIKKSGSGSNENVKIYVNHIDDSIKQGRGGVISPNEKTLFANYLDLLLRQKEVEEAGTRIKNKASPGFEIKSAYAQCNTLQLI
eukprot:scaffold20690_cov155-Skeletonema_dohrnii-CCMP3373.AAC.11